MKGGRGGPFKEAMSSGKGGQRVDVRGGFQDAAGVRKSVQGAAHRCAHQPLLPLCICVRLCSLADTNAN